MKLNETGPELSSKDIKRFEKKQGIKLPEPYKKFLTENNGGYPGKSLFKISDAQGESVLNIFFGIGDMYDNLADFIRIYKGRMPEEFFPIADDSNGNSICLGLEGQYQENIFFWDHEQENEDADMSNMYFLAKDIYEFVESLQ